MQQFTHLHVHTEYSLLDGAGRIEDLVRRAKELGMPAVAITDHGTMYGTIDFYKQAKKYGIKPIIGCEVYVAPRSGLIRPPWKVNHIIIWFCWLPMIKATATLLNWFRAASSKAFIISPGLTGTFCANTAKG